MEIEATITYSRILKVHFEILDVAEPNLTDFTLVFAVQIFEVIIKMSEQYFPPAVKTCFHILW